MPRLEFKHHDRIGRCLAEAAGIAQAIADDESRQSALSALARSFVSFGDLAGARQLTEKFVGAQAAGDRSYALAGIARAFAAAGDIAAAKQICAEIQTDDGREQISIFEAIAQAQAKAGDIEAAIETRSQIKPYFAPHEIGIAEMRLTNQGIDASTAHKQIEEAQTLSGMARAKAAVAGDLAQAGNLAKAHELWSEVRRVAGSIVISEWAQPSLVEIARQQIGIGDVAAAMDTIRGMPPQMPVSELYVDAMNMKLKAGDFAAARNIADDIELRQERCDSYIGIGKASLRSGDSMAAARIFEEAIALPATQGSQVQARGDIAEALGIAGDLAGATKMLAPARALADGFVTRGLKASAYVRIGTALVKIGPLTSAHEALAIAGETMPGANVIRAQVDAGDLAGAKITAGRMKGFSENWALIAVAEAKAGDIAGACNTAAAISDESTRFSTLKQIAEVIAGAGNIAQAKRIAAELPRDWRSNGLRVIAECQASAGDFAGAVQTAAEIEEDHRAKTSCYYVVALKMALAGELDGTGSLVQSLGHDPMLYAWVLIGFADGLMSASQG